jgi:hypothetical protein
VSEEPLIENCTSAEWRSAESCPSRPWARGERTSLTVGSVSSFATTRFTVRLKAGSLT